MQNNKNTWRVTFLLLAISLIGVFPLDVILPSFPSLADHFSASLEGLSLTLSVFAAGVATAQLLIGPLSDVFGRKSLLVGGLLLAAAGAISATQAQSFSSFIVFRFVQALGCGCFVLVNAVIQDAYSAPARTRIRIVTTTASGVFISLAPLAGYGLQGVMGWEGSFWVFAGFTLIISGLCVCWLPKKAPEGGVLPKYLFASLLALSGNVRFMGYCALSALAFACHFSFIALSPGLFFTELGLTQYQYAAVLLCYGLAYIVGGTLALWMQDRRPMKLQVLLGLVAIAMAGILLVSLQLLGLVSTGSVLACMILCTCGVTVIRPIATTKALNLFPDRAGAASSLLNTSVFVFGALVSALLAWAPYPLVVKLGGALGSLGVIGLTLVWRQAQRNTGLG